MIYWQACLAVAMLGGDGRAAGADDQAVRKAVRHLCVALLTHARLDYHVQATYEIADAPRIIKEGDFTFAKGDEAAFLRFSLTETTPATPKLAKSVRRVPPQELLIELGKPQLRFYTTRKSQKSSVASVTVNAAAGYPDFLANMLEEAFLNWIIDEGPGTPLGPDSILSFVDTHDGRIVADRDDRLRLAYESPYGSLEIELGRAGGSKNLQRIGLKKTRASREGYSDRTLGDLTGVYQLGDGLAGVDEQEFGIEMTYPPLASNLQPFTSLTFTQASRSGRRVGKTVVGLFLKDHRAAMSDDAIRKLPSVTADGTKVDSPNPDLKDLDLCWQDGRVVRRVDGKVLNLDPTILPPAAGSGWAMKVLALNVLILTITGAWYMFGRASIKSK